MTPAQFSIFNEAWMAHGDILTLTKFTELCIEVAVSAFEKEDVRITQFWVSSAILASVVITEQAH